MSDSKMISPRHAAITFSNNIVGNLNVLWAIAEINKSIKYIKLGSAGCYLGIDTDFVPLKKVNLSFHYKQKLHKVLRTWLPMQATDFYHQSKINDFLVNDLCSHLWGLKIITVQQSTIFGATIQENESIENHGLSTRFNYDQIFGTVLNRFVCQIAIDHPMTVYGNGTQKTGLISLTDTIDNFIKFFSRQLKGGSHTVEHNYTDKLSINEIAKILMLVSDHSKVDYIENPRVEANSKLKKIFELNPSIFRTGKEKNKKLTQELRKLLEFAELYRANIKRSIIFPTVHWKK